MDSTFVDSLLQWKLPEDIHLDYKHGDFLRKKRDSGIANPAERLRAWVSSFANSDGGILVVGVVAPDATDSQTPAWTLTDTPKGDRLDEWAREVLRTIAPSFSAPPKHWVVSHSDGNLLVVACRRSDELVRVVVGGTIAYYLRVGDSTARVPDYLMADLVLGRRTRAVLSLVQSQGGAPQMRYQGTPPGRDSILNISLIVMNEGMSWADDLVVGGIGFCDKEGSGTLLPAVLQSAIDVRSAGITHSKRVLSRDSRTVEPFGKSAIASLIWWLPNPGDGDWYGAFYVLARNAPPRWYQAIVNRRRHKLEIDISPVDGQRPIVQWNPIPSPADAPQWAQVDEQTWMRLDGLMVKGSPGSWAIQDVGNIGHHATREEAMQNADQHFPISK